jgi:integrin beta 3
VSGVDARQNGPLAGGVVRLRGARSELRRQLREQRRVRAIALATVVVLVLGAPMLYFGILFATRDPVLNSLDRLQVPEWAAVAPEDRIITGSRWCFIDCRFRERTLESLGEPAETTAAYQAALLEAGWTRWEVGGCPQVAVDGDYSCWTRDEYTLDLWVRPPECAYDPLNLRPELAEQADPPEEGADPDPGQDCSGSVVEIKMQNRVSDERGLPGPAPDQQPGIPPGEQPASPPVSPPPTASPTSGS